MLFLFLSCWVIHVSNALSASVPETLTFPLLPLILNWCCQFPGSSLFFSFSRCGHLASFDYLIIYYSFYLSLINILLLTGTLVPNLHQSSQSQPSNLSLALANGFASYFTTKFEVLYLLSPYP